MNWFMIVVGYRVGGLIMMRWVVLCVVVMVLVFVGFVNVKVVEYDFEVVYVDVVLDCYVKMVIGINGVYLGLIICVV